MDTMKFVDLLVVSGLGFKLAIVDTVADVISCTTISGTLRSCVSNPFKYLVVVNGKHVMLLDTGGNAEMPTELMLNPYSTTAIHRYNVLYHSTILTNERLLVSNTSRLLKRFTNNTPSLLQSTTRDVVAMAANMFSQSTATALDAVLLSLVLVTTTQAAHVQGIKWTIYCYLWHSYHLSKQCKQLTPVFKTN
jgi:hypothetical protein